MNDVVPSSLTRLKHLAALHRTMTSSLTFEEVLGLVAGSGVELVGAVSCLLLLREGEDGLRICAAEGVDPTAAARFVGPMEESVLEKLQEHLGLQGAQPMVALPIMTDHLVQGILVVISEHALTPEETWLLSTLADQAAVTLGNAHLRETLRLREGKLRDEVERSRSLAGELEALILSAAQALQEPLRTLTAGGTWLPGESQALTGTDRRQLALFASGARKMDAVIHELLTGSPLARAGLNLEPVDLEAAVLEALAELRTEIQSRGGQLRLESLRFRVLAHRDILGSILENLVSDALKFLAAGEPPAVEVKAELLGRFVRISVVDRGIGISEARLDRIFGGLEGPGRAAETPGTSIGLAIVQKSIERMGGRCGVESEPGKGGRFWIDLRGAGVQSGAGVA